MSEAARAPTERFGERAAKALTESMTVLDDQTFGELRDEEFLVVTPSGTYRVDAIAHYSRADPYRIEEKSQTRDTGGE